MDADLSHNPSDIKKLIDKQKRGFDIVLGSRYRNSVFSGTFGWNFKRKIISRGANNLAQIMLNIKVSDATGSFRIYKKDVFENLIEKVKSSGYAYQIEIMHLAEKMNYKIDECDIIFHERVNGESKLGIFEIFYFLYILVYLMICK
ncbi:dolichol-P-mannose synthesis [Gurleya vavrai]